MRSMVCKYARILKLKMVWEEISLPQSFLSEDPYNSVVGYLKQLLTRGAQQ